MSPSKGHRMQVVCKKTRNFRPIWCHFQLPSMIFNPDFKGTPLFDVDYLRNGTRHRHSCNGILIGSYTHPTEHPILTHPTLNRTYGRFSVGVGFTNHRHNNQRIPKCWSCPKFWDVIWLSTYMFPTFFPATHFPQKVIYRGLHRSKT